MADYNACSLAGKTVDPVSIEANRSRLELNTSQYNLYLKAGFIFIDAKELTTSIDARYAYPRMGD